MGGSRDNQSKTIRNILIVFIVSGLWHGASWNFVVWGALNGLFLIVFDKILAKESKIFLVRLIKATFVTAAWTVSLIFFRAADFKDSFQIFQNLGFGNSDILYELGLNKIEFRMVSYLLLGLILFELLIEKKENLYTWFVARPFYIRWAVYISLITFIVFYGSYGVGLNDQNFIYFQF